MAWTSDTTSNTSRRNVSRFVLLHRSAGSVSGGVDFGIYVRDNDEFGRGVSAFVDDSNPVRIHDSGDSTV